MRILWLCNVTLPQIAEKLNIKNSAGGGWLIETASAIANDPSNALGYVFPQSINHEMIAGTCGDIRYWGFPRFTDRYEEYDSSLEEEFLKITEEFNPDVIHVWGTEFPHSLAMIKAATDKERVIISIQGLCSIYAEHYFAYMPKNACRPTFRDIIKGDSLYQQQRAFEKRGENEIAALALTKNVIGRTRWDKTCAEQLAPDARYFHCNESLRAAFYESAGKWNYEACEPHSIFVSQSSYPIKGFHLVLEAAAELKKEFKDLKIYTTGSDPRSIPTYKIGTYRKYLVSLMDKYDLNASVEFLGTLGESEMCESFLKSNVFVSASSIENSPNSVGEAMLLGVPTVASYVGGTMDMLDDSQDGFLYPADEPYMLEGYIRKLFTNPSLCRNLGQNACRHASATHDREKNYSDLMNIYKQVAGEAQ